MILNPQQKFEIIFELMEIEAFWLALQLSYEVVWVSL
jgi:hypothetical protein